MPQSICTDKAPTGSSIFIASNMIGPRQDMRTPIIPMTMDSHGLRIAQPAAKQIAIFEECPNVAYYTCIMFLV